MSHLSPSDYADLQAAVAKLETQSFAMKVAGSRFLARQECCSQLNSIGTQSQCCSYPSRISDSARSDHRHIDDVYDLRDERERAHEGILRGPEERTAMPTGLKA